MIPRLIGTPSAHCLTCLLCPHLPGPPSLPTVLRAPSVCSLELRVLTTSGVMMWEIRESLFTVTDLEPWPGIAHQQRAQVRISPDPGLGTAGLPVTQPDGHRPLQPCSLRLLHFGSRLSLLSEGPGWTVLSAGLRWFL